MHVEQARSGLADGFDDIGARASSMPGIDADPATRVHIFYNAERALRSRKMLVFRPVVVNRDLDVVLLHEALDARHGLGCGSDGDHGHGAGLGVLEVAANISVV